MSPATPPSVPRQASAGDESGRLALDLIHRLLADELADWSLPGVAAQLAAAFGAPGAGLADVVTGQAIVRVPADRPCPWEQSPEVLEQSRDAWTAVPLSAGDRSWLLASAAAPGGQGGWLLFLEDAAGRVWTAAERAALVLAAQVLARGSADGPRWGRQLDVVRRRQRLEDSARAVQRLAHDYGNILTTILGFSELGLNLPDPGQPLATYLQEVHRAAEQASQYTDRLRLFSRRGSPGPRCAALAAVAAEEADSVRALWGGRTRLEIDVPPGLPPARVTADMLRRVMRELLDNAHEAAVGPGAVTVTAREVTLTESDCLDYLGRPSPGPALEVSVADDGPGLSAEARRNVLATPFFTTRPKRRGLGLATVYGILHVHNGGLSIGPRPGGGTVVRFVLPPAPREALRERAADAPAATTPQQRPLPSRPAGPRERVLVVDDDPLVLRLVSTTLERDGYRVHTALSGAEALRRYTATDAEPFRLVLSDVVMPVMNGVDLARRLVQHNANVNLLFMSGQVSPDFAPENWGGGSFPLIRKPFRPEGLLRAVRAALDAGRPRPPVPAVPGPDAASPMPSSP